MAGSGGSRVPNKPSKGLTKDDYIYAKEVAYQPADNRRQALHKKQSQIDLDYLKKKYPQIRKNYDVKGTTVSVINKTYNV
jgi:hypothetical protein